MYMCLLFALIFLIPTVFLLMGKWSWIVPGYNTATPAEKRHYDEKKMCRAVGIMFSVMTLGFLVCAVFSRFVEIGRLDATVVDDVKKVFFVIVIAGASATTWYVRKRCMR
ncbi:MAG: DUF3784 domain-containing protein [Oscillospiraceae bacterium]|nr:DUF3784 domain-containing protein [Oscillospiraceae bacterium]